MLQSKPRKRYLNNPIISPAALMSALERRATVVLRIGQSVEFCLALGQSASVPRTARWIARCWPEESRSTDIGHPGNSEISSMKAYCAARLTFYRPRRAVFSTFQSGTASDSTCFSLLPRSGPQRTFSSINVVLCERRFERANQRGADRTEKRTRA